MNFYPTFFVTSVSSSDSKLTLTINGAPSTNPKSIARFIFAPNISLPSDSEETNEVQVSIGGTDYPLLDKFGDALTVSELPKATTPNGTFLRPRIPLTCGLGNTSFVCWNLPIPTEYVIPL